MSIDTRIRTQSQTHVAAVAPRLPHPSVAVPEHETERPDIAIQLEDAARLGHSLGAIRADGSAPLIVQRQELPEEEEEEELQMQRDLAPVQRQEIPEEEEELQMQPDDPQVGLEGGPVPPDVEATIGQARGHGQLLDSTVQAQMGETLGHDFSAVRVHTDGEADALNRPLSAKAFTTGRDIFFRQGEYNPGSSSGRELLAHELSHVVQQSSGRVSGSGGGMTVRPAGDEFEQEGNTLSRQETIPQSGTGGLLVVRVVHRMGAVIGEADTSLPGDTTASPVSPQPAVERPSGIGRAEAVVQRYPLSKGNAKGLEEKHWAETDVGNSIAFTKFTSCIGLLGLNGEGTRIKGVHLVMSVGGEKGTSIQPADADLAGQVAELFRGYQHIMMFGSPTAWANELGIKDFWKGLHDKNRLNIENEYDWGDGSYNLKWTDNNWEIVDEEEEEEEEKEELQMKPDLSRVGLEGGPVPLDVETAIGRARGGGQPLEGTIQAQMGDALGHDFSTVRVHADEQADVLNQQLSARAFTTGRDIFFRQGTYDPASSSGRELIAHELTHVVQQSTGRVSGRGDRITVHPAGDAFEQEADSHVQLAATTSGELVSPLSQASESQHVVPVTAIVQRDWVPAKPGHLKWDKLLGGLLWHWNSDTQKLYYTVEKGDELSPGDLERLAKRQGEEYTYDEWRKAGWRGLKEDEIAPHQPEIAGEATGEAPGVVPPEAQEIINEFNRGGLLIRTLQKEFAHQEFDNLLVSVEEALRAVETGQSKHTGLRKWTLAQKDLLANYYKMGPEVLALERYMAVLASPSKIGGRFVGVHEKDRGSGGLQKGTKLIDQDKALVQIGKLLETLKANQASIKKPLENNEIQTLGFKPDAVSALMYKAGGGLGSPKSWTKAKPIFQEVVNRIGRTQPGKSFYVFTYDVVERNTILTYLDTLSPQTQ